MTFFIGFLKIFLVMNKYFHRIPLFFAYKKTGQLTYVKSTSL